jgi:cob(I)alamin adenosyltransferase
MQIETPPTEKRYEKPEGERRGLVIVNTGDGKGKSTAAFGLALRAHGRGKAVKIYQFMKVPTARFGEHRMFEQIGLPIEGLGDGFSAGRARTWSIPPSWRATAGPRRVPPSSVASTFMVVLDEITYPLIYGWLPLQDVLRHPAQRGPGTCMWCLTGRRCPRRSSNWPTR